MFVVLLPTQNRWQELSREDQEPTSESPPSTQSHVRCPTERCNGSQRTSQLEEGGDYRQDGKVPPQSLCKEQELGGGTTQSVFTQYQSLVIKSF